MTQYLSALNPFNYQAPRALVSGVFQGGRSLAIRASEAAVARLEENPIAQAAGRAVAHYGENLAVGISRFVIRKIQPAINGRLVDSLPTFKKALTNTAIEGALAPTPLTEDEKAAQTYINWLLELIKDFIKQKVLRADVAYLINHAVERVLAKGRLQSIAFNILTRINIHAPSILKEVNSRAPTDHEIDKVLKASHQKILKSDYYNTGVSWFGKVCIAPKIGQAFTREAFDGYVSALSESLDTQLGGLNEFLGTEHRFESPEQKQAFVERMVLEMLEAVVEEISSPNMEVDNPLVHRGLEREAQKLIKSLQPFIPQNPDLFEVMLEEEELRVEALEEFREEVAGEDFVEQVIEDVQPYVEESQNFAEQHPWLAKGLNFFGYDTSAEAMEARLVEMRINSVVEREELEQERVAYEASLEDEELEAHVHEIDQHLQSMEAISGLLNEAIHSPRTVDILFDGGFSVSSLFEKYRTRLLEDFHSLETEEYSLDVDEAGALYVKSIEQEQTYNPEDDLVEISLPYSERVEPTPDILALLPVLV